MGKGFFARFTGRRGPLTAHQATDKGGEDPLEMLRVYDVVFLVDDSGSMAGTRWSEARDALMDVAEQAAMYDEDGVDVFFLNSKVKGTGMKSTSQIERLFSSVRPTSTTPTGARIDVICGEYLNQLDRAKAAQLAGKKFKEVKPLNLIVITDGAPSDDPESVIVALAKRLDNGNYPLSQLGIQMLQVGDDAGAAAALAELDDVLSARHGIRDMVDTAPYTGERMTAAYITKVLLGSVNRREDKKHVDNL